LGAEVIKIERPGGDYARSFDGVVRGQSAYFVWLNRGKRSVVLDLKVPSDKNELERLLGEADVFVHNLGPGAMARLGFGRSRIERSWPSLITCAISGYGIDGPLGGQKAVDLLLQAESGLISLTGTDDHPSKVGVSIADISAGMYALSAVLAALVMRQATSRGSFIDISMLECLAEWLMAPLYHQIFLGSQPPRTGMRHNMLAPYGPYPAGDGRLVNLVVQSPEQWERLCVHVLDRPDLVADERFRTNELRVRNSADLDRILEDALGTMSSSELILRLGEADLPTGSVNSLADLAAHPQLAARERWIQVESPRGPVPALLPPFNISGTRQFAGAVPDLELDGTGSHRTEAAP
jgi:crotonobetainyl-CoA:carnitine CoA-transferase CaiB-like acyl-CoA transferase